VIRIAKMLNVYCIKSQIVIKYRETHRWYKNGSYWVSVKTTGLNRYRFSVKKHS